MAACLLAKFLKLSESAFLCRRNSLFHSIEIIHFLFYKKTKPVLVHLLQGTLFTEETESLSWWPSFLLAPKAYATVRQPCYTVFLEHTRYTPSLGLCSYPSPASSIFLLLSAFSKSFRSLGSKWSPRLSIKLFPESSGIFPTSEPSTFNNHHHLLLYTVVSFTDMLHLLNLATIRQGLNLISPPLPSAHSWQFANVCWL